MNTISSYNAATWLPSAVSAQSQDASNWISQSLDTSGSLGLPHSAALQDFIDTTSAVADAFSGAQQNQAQGLAALAIQAATNRIKADLNKKIDELTNSTSQLPVAAAPASIYLANGSVLNLAKNTFTLSDGSILDIATGLKVTRTVVDVTA
jgi:hypothetical protein